MNLLRRARRLLGTQRHALPVIGAVLALALEAIRLGAVEKISRFDHTLEEWQKTELLWVLAITGFLFACLMTRRTLQLNREIEQRKEAERTAQELARHDALTGLANRRALAEKLDDALADTGRRSGAWAVLLVDLDRFKQVNDLHGHAAGDMVLREVAHRLNAAIGPLGTAARFGGDEFAVVGEFARKEQATLLAQKIIQALSRPIALHDKEVEIGATVGIALHPTDGTDAEALLRSADLALYRAKRTARGTYCAFEPSIETELRTRAALEAELLEAVAKSRIKPHYQPLVSLSDQKLFGFEILSRWYHPEKGILSPDVFIPVAEETGLIVDITYSVLRRACLDARNWPAYLILALNISPVHLRDHSLPERLLAILTETGFAPGRLEIEITENALIGDWATVKDVVLSLQNLGVRVSLDDFGTGYSSLAYLRELSFDKLKMDRSFVRSIRDGQQGIDIATAVIGLGKSLGMPVVAEGIESAADYRSLLELGCTDGQGFYFGEPLPPIEVAKLFQLDETPSRSAPTPMAAAG